MGGVVKQDNNKDFNSKQSSIIVKVHSEMSNRGQNNLRHVKGIKCEIGHYA